MSSSRRVALVLAYDGTDFAGWQRQADAPTVQAAVEDALSRIARCEVAAHAASRTDAGVHASAQVAHADLPASLDEHPQAIRRRLNGVLPRSVRVRAVADMAADFHARQHAEGKRYEYRMRLAPYDDPLTSRYRAHVSYPVRLEAMREAAGRFVGRRDFAALRSTGSSVVTTEREITACDLLGEPPELDLVVEGTGFLRHMVRALAGSLVEVGRGRHRAEWIDEVLAAADRSGAGPNVPAHGLHLVGVRYAAPHAARIERALAEEHARFGSDQGGE